MASNVINSDGSTNPEITGGGSSGSSALPFDLSSLFPSFQPIKFNPVKFPTIQPANYNMIDPQQFATGFGAFNRNQITKNYAQAKGFALDTLDTELAGLRGYAPAASALSREQTSLDNMFNQQQRTSQVRGALPGVEGDLAGQRSRANSYANGLVPNSILDRSLELGIRSRAADESSFAGFGPKSAQSNKISDLMSAEERVKLSQYGDSLLGQNINTRAGLFLAPTEYAQTGSKINPMPAVDAGTRAMQEQGVINEATLLSPSTALGSKIQQEQFGTTLDQRTREFNSTGKFNASTFNSQGQMAASEFNSTGGFTAGLGLFGYQAGVATQLQAANQGNLNSATAAQSASLGFDTQAGQFHAVQPTSLQSVAQGLGAISSGLNAASNILSPSQLPLPNATIPNTTMGTVGSSPSAPSVSTPDVAPLISGQSSIAPTALAVDAASPSTLKFAAGVPTPSGYTPISSNSDGTYSAANTQDYGQDLERFARFGKSSSGTVSVQNAAMADRNIANAAGLSYVPIQGFAPIALSSSGKQVYSLPAAASSGDISKGANNISSLGSILAQLGVSDESIYDQLSQFHGDVSDPAFHDQLDKLLSEKGQDAVAAAISNKFGKDVSLDSDAGQQLQFASSRIGELWGSLSPAQRSLALTSLAGPAVQARTGKNLADINIPNTENSVLGPLKTSDAMGLTDKGLNGFGLARNWNQLSAIGKIGADAKNATGAAKLADQTGLLGYGVQGASVPLHVGQLAKMGAQPIPELGVGAVVLNRESQIPNGYKVVSQTPDKRLIAMPENLSHTSGLNHAPMGQAFKSAAIIATGQHPAQRLWPSGDARSIVRGSAGGSSIISGLGIMAKANPALLASIVAHSFYNETIGT